MLSLMSAENWILCKESQLLYINLYTASLDLMS